jgi:hypothetical protein
LVFKRQEHPKSLDRVIVFAGDQSEKFYCDVYYVQSIEAGRIITENQEVILPLEDAKPFVTKEGMMYAYNASLEYLNEVQHLGEVEKNIVISQAFLYPGRALGEKQSNMTNILVIGVLALVAIVGLFV